MPPGRASGLLAHASSSDVVLYASKASVKSGTWAVVADSTAAGGYAIGNPNLGAAKISTPLAAPKSYFELTFPAYSGKAYHLWIRAKSLSNASSNDSVFVQFSDSVNSSKSAVYRIGTASAAPVVLQACTGAAIQGWGWTDNGWNPYHPSASPRRRPQHRSNHAVPADISFCRPRHSRQRYR